MTAAPDPGAVRAGGEPAPLPTEVEGAPTRPRTPLPGGARLPVVLDLADPLPDIPTQGAKSLHVTALWRGQPLGTTVVDSPADPFPAALLPVTLAHAFGGALLDQRVQEVLTPPQDTTSTCTSTVVICTRNRYDTLARCLASMAALDPDSRREVLVVDNGDGDDATRRLVTGYGFRWVHEPVPGLDRARNRGLLEAAGEIVLFADDDVHVRPSWAAQLVRCFDDPLVGAATGLVLPAVLDSEYQRTFESHFGFSRGMQRRVLDGAYDAPTRAGSLGAGASMALRRELLLDIGGFPEVLDGGMPTKSGGDTYGLYRILRAGYRGVFEPRAQSLHWHRDGHDELIRTVTGYSTGTYSFLLYALVHDRDPLVLAAIVRWTTGWVLGRLVRAALGRRGAPPLALALAYVIGAWRAPAALRAAHGMIGDRSPLLSAQGIPRSPRSLPSAAPPLVGDSPGQVSSVSVVIPSRGRRDQVIGLVQALGRQHVVPSEIVVVVDGDVDGTAAAVAALPSEVPVRVVVHDVNRGAAAARNSGFRAAACDLVLFLDDDVMPTGPDVVATHVAEHRRFHEPVAVVGPCAPADLPAQTPMLLGVRNWWVDHMARLAVPGPLSFTDLGTGNVSLRRSVLESVGGFREMPRREDWELGLRLQRAGVAIVAAPTAVVSHPIEADAGTYLRDRGAEGAGDLRVAEHHPEVAHQLPLWQWFSLTPKRKALVTTLFLAPDAGRHALPPLAALVSGLDRVGARGPLWRNLRHAAFVAYWAGVAREATSEQRFLDVLSASPAWATTTDVPAAPFELRSPHWGAPPPGAVDLAVMLDGRPVGTVSSSLGGFPWSAGEFGRRLQVALPRDRVADLLSRRTA